MVVASAPVAMPVVPPRRARRMASVRNWTRIWPLVAPRARRRPISERRSRTEMTMMLATPIAPTSSATAPRPRNRTLNALLASAWATAVAGAEVDRGGVPVEAEVALGGGVADEDGGVDAGGEWGWSEDPDD